MWGVWQKRARPHTHTTTHTITTTFHASSRECAAIMPKSGQPKEKETKITTLHKWRERVREIKAEGNRKNGIPMCARVCVDANEEKTEIRRRREEIGRAYLLHGSLPPNHLPWRKHGLLAGHVLDTHFISLTVLVIIQRELNGVN